VPSSPAAPLIRHPRLRVGLAFAGGALALIALSGCAPAAPASNATPKPTSTPTHAATTAPTEGATPTPTPDVPDTPVTLDCDQLLTPDDVYAFNPNFGTAPDYKPEAGSKAGTAVKYDGVACGWLNQTSGEIIEVAVAQPNEAHLTDLKNQAVSGSKAVPTYGTPPAIDGFFTSASGSGTAEAFSGKYWVVLNSVAFFEPGDAQELVAAVVSHLP
jgi:hypothetical protein